MELVIRACRPEEMARYGEIISYVFAENDAELIRREIEATDPEWTHCAFDNDRMVGTMGVIPFTLQMNGRAMSAGGVTGVGTLPELRRRGVLRQVMTSGLELMRDRGQSIAILWASMGAIYQRFGYGRASGFVGYRFDPRDGRLERGPTPSGSCSLLPRAEAEPIIRDVYQSFLAPRNLMLHRTDFFWDSDLREQDHKPRHIVVYRNGHGEATGYAIYTTEDKESSGPGPSQELSVKDFIALDVDAFAGLWQYICAHDLVKTVVIRGRVAEDDPAPDLLSEPRMLNRWTGDAIWLRITDIEHALPARGYGVGAGLVFAIPTDPECPWNEGTWKLEVDDAGALIKRTSETPQLTMPMNSLSSLLTGFRSASHLARISRIDVHDVGALRTADAIFATEYRPFLPNDF